MQSSIYKEYVKYYHLFTLGSIKKSEEKHFNQKDY